MIQHTNAVVELVLASMKQFHAWAFFLAWPGVGHQSWDSVVAFGMMVFYTGALWYFKIDFDEADHAYLEACSQDTS